MYKVLISVFTATLLMCSLKAQLSVSAELDSTNILIGDQVRLHLLINHLPDVKIQRIDLSGLQSVEEIEVLDIQRLDTINSKDEFLLEQWFTLTSFDSGAHWVPPIPVEYVYKGQNGKAETNQLPLIVRPFPIESDTSQLAPIKPIIEEPLKFEDFMWYLIGILLVGGLIGFLIYQSRRKNEEEEEEIIEIKRPAHEIAIDKLGRLKAAKLWQQGKIKDFHSELTYILREYLENRYEVQALESTTYEIKQALGKLDIPEDYRMQIQQLLQTADMVKFAKAEPPVEMHADALSKTESFIDSTKRSTEEFEAMLQTIEEQRMAEAKAKLEEEEIQLASLSNRLIAAVIDGIFSIAIFLVLFFSSLALGGLSEVVSNIILIASLVVWFILHLGIEVWFGGLPGKLLLGMKVKTEDFQQITFKQAYHRFIYKIRSLFVIFSVIGALRREDRMLRHDEITQTRVFKV
ncbi:MAG: RDD family protein [Saprospiraceae bacterium]|nr:RDD family protein [Saprospiraceae bacterium]